MRYAAPRLDQRTASATGARRPRLAIIAGWIGCAGLCIAACASARSTSVSPRTTGPFIKLAKREIALIVHSDAALPAGEQDVLLNTLRDRLQVIYRTEVDAVRGAGTFSRLAPDQLASFALKGIDDAVVVDLRSARGDVVKGRVRVVPLARLRTTIDVTIPDIRSQPGPARARRIAETAARRLSFRWTDPGAEPTMDPLATAARLADNQACKSAIRIYARVLPGRGPGSLLNVDRHQAAQRRYDRCRAEVQLSKLMADDAAAQFSLKVDASPMAPRIEAAVNAALPNTGLTRLVAQWTDKPALIVVRPEILSLELRMHPDRYERALGNRPRYDRDMPVLYLDPFVGVIEALLDLREAAISKLPPYDGNNLRQLQTQVRFRRLPNDSVTIVFSDVEGRLLFADGLLVKMGRRPEVRVDSLSDDVSRSLRFLLGPPEDATGAVTDYGLVFRFFGLQ